MKFAEPFVFARANPTWTSDLVLLSPDGESGRRVGKGEWRGDPQGKLIGVPFLLVTFLCQEILHGQRKVTRHQGEIKCW